MRRAKKDRAADWAGPTQARQQQAQHPEGHGPGGVQEEHQQPGHHQDDEAGHDDVARSEAVIEPPGPDSGDTGHDVGHDGEDDDVAR